MFRIQIRIRSGFNQVRGSVSGSEFGRSLFRAEGFFCSLDVLSGGLGIGTCMIAFDSNKFLFIFYFFQFLVVTTLDQDWIRIDIQPKMLDPDPDQYQMINEYGSETENI